MKEITYTTEESEIVGAYERDLDSAFTLKKLHVVADKWGELVPDIVDPIKSMSKDDFREWRKCLRTERQGEYSGNAAMEKFGAILLPDYFISASFTSAEYGVPWGCAYIRIRESQG